MESGRGVLSHDGVGEDICLSHHHEKVMEAYHVHLSKWNKVTQPLVDEEVKINANSGRGGGAREHYRCSACWLRSYDCYCELQRLKLEERRQLYLQHCDPSKVKVTIYYHFQELGRSPNTMHLLPLVAPHICSSLVFCDLKAETELIQTIIEEAQSSDRRTCILYPSPDSMLLPDFVAAATRSSGGGRFPVEGEPGSMQSKKKPINLVVLDGTYSLARRQLRHLEAMLREHSQAVRLPVVKLDLGDNGCASAIMGIMKQPSIDKICSMQATVIGLRQTGEVSEEACAGMDQDLADWLSHLLQRGIKECKNKIEIGGKKYSEDTYKPIDAVTSHINKKKLKEEESKKKMFSINQTENCAIGKFRMQILQVPHYIECVKRTPTYQINLVETKKFATYDLVHKGEGRRRHQKLSNYKYYKKFVKQQQEAESLYLDEHHCAQTTSGNSEIMSAVESNDFLGIMCVELTVQPSRGSNSIVSGTCRKNELIHFRHCVCDI